MRRVLVIGSLLLALGCDQPRDRTCRALVLQAANAEAAQRYVPPAPRLDAYRAQSAARWIRATDLGGVDDAELKSDAAAMADALDRLASARLALADAMPVFEAKDVPELVMRAHACVETSCETIEVARAVAAAVTERGRADAEIKSAASSVRAKCGAPSP